MTDVSDAVQPDVEAPESTDDETPAATPRSARRLSGAALLAFLAAVVAVVGSVLLPFAPVTVNEPTVSWPRDPARPESTMLTLSAYRPLQMDIRFTCDVARVAQLGSGLVVSTTLPESPLPVGLRAEVVGGRLQVQSLGKVLVDEPLPAGPCEYVITGTSSGRPVPLPPIDPGPDPAAPEPPTPGARTTAAAADALLVISRDGTELSRTLDDRLPDVDTLATSITGLPPAAAGGLAVKLRIDDEFTSSPSAPKMLLILLVIAAMLICAALLARIDRRTPRVPWTWQLAAPRIVDIGVPLVMLIWMIVAPTTDDDGYYAAMSRNAQATGEVGNYYQLYDQNFTPFTWFYQALSWWQQLAGDAPVMQRIPALVFGLLTWLLLRRFVIAAMAEWAPKRGGVRAVARNVLGAAFLAWWVPQAMGVRPESMVALCAAGALVAVLAAARRKRLLYGWIAFLLAGLGFAAHPTGFTLLGPLLAGLPLLWPLVNVDGSRMATLQRGFAVVSGGMISPLVAFADGSLRDFRRGQAIFLSVQGQEGWTSEYLRYQFLLSDIAMGNFAKRAVVLICIVALVWFAVLGGATKARRVHVPEPLWLAGASTALAFALLWLTPSKWTHHFGALAGVGPAFLALVLVMCVPLIRETLDGARLHSGVLVALSGSFVMAIALAWHGPNTWAYAWLAGVRLPDVPPAIKNVTLSNPLVWIALLVVIGFMLSLLGRFFGTRDVRITVVRAVPVVVVLALMATVVYTVSIFAVAAVRGLPKASIWAQSLADPTASQCAAGGAVDVLDPDTATPLDIAAQLPTPPAPQGFVPGDGFYDGNRPRTSAPVWGTLIAKDGRTAEHMFGDMTTNWYQLPNDLPPGAAVTVLAAGTLSDGNSLTATYGSETGRTVVDVGTQKLADAERSPVWRTLVLKPPPGANVVRLDASDATGFIHGWLAFSAPEVQRPIPLRDLVPAGAPVALGWQIAFNYPCLRQSGIVDGITEPPQFGVLWGAQPLGGLIDVAWQPQRGSVFGQVQRSQSVQQLATVGPVDPHIQVYAFGSRLARDAYTLTTTTRMQWGASIATGTAPPAP